MADDTRTTPEQMHGAAALVGAVFAIGVAWDDAFDLTRIVLAVLLGLAMTVLIGAAGFYLVRRLSPDTVERWTPLRVGVLLLGAGASFWLTQLLTTFLP